MGRAIINFLATGAWVGLSPKIPGTIGTLWGIPIAWALAGLSPVISGVIIIIAIIAACVVAGQAEKYSETKDPGSIVIDEIVGFMVAFYLLPFTLLNVILVFAVFRFFDILKPFPIRVIDKKLGGGTGIVLDDVVAGIFTNIVVHGIILVIQKAV